MRNSIGFLILACTMACSPQPNKPGPAYTEDYMATTLQAIAPVDSSVFIKSDSGIAQKIIAFAKTQIGTPYKSCSMDPEHGGFDCSGFINYVFNHFNIKVPRSSVDFTNLGTQVPLGQCRQGDLILFTGTDKNIRTVGHIGLIVSNDNNGNITFIQSTSGADYGVVISPLNDAYRARFVKVVRIIGDSE
jgi:cell wall-associated NlpC family hydrolase